jgi:hypothetical protein
MRKPATQLLGLLVVLVVMFGVIGLMHCGPPRSWHDFSGMTEAEVRARLGEPFRDNRKDGTGDAKHYTLGWHQGFETGLFLEFKDGVVVSQKRYSR